MTDRSLKCLNYGHPGAATYDLESETWSFTKNNASKNFRQVQTRPNGQLLGTCTKNPSIHYHTPQVSANRSKLEDVALKLAHERPQLAPATSYSADLALLSVALQNTTSTYDPRIGSLFAIGSCTTEGTRHRPRRIAAVAAGETGNILQLTLMTKERLAEVVDQTVCLEGPSLREADCGYWNEEAAPIQQICFSHSKDRSSLLAVRLPARTVILRPMHQSQGQTAKQSPFHYFPPTAIDAHPILSIGADQTGGSPHIDIVFNPESQSQLGIVNQNQVWSVWEIVRKGQQDVYSVFCKVQGFVSPSENANLSKEDNWARMLFVRDLYTLLVCNRRHLNIVSIREETPTYLSCPSVIGERSTDWILDVRRHPRIDDHVLALTSTHLFLLKIDSSGERSHTIEDKAGASILVSWRHYRGQEDFTLQLDVQMLTDEESCVLLYSRLNFLVQIYTYKEHPSSAAEATVCFDPSMVDLKLTGPGYINHLHLEPMQSVLPGPKKTVVSDHAYMGKEYMFYRMFVTRSDLSVHEMVFYTHDYGADVESSLDHDVEDFERSSIIHLSQSISQKEIINEDDDFIVPDGVMPVSHTRFKYRAKKVQQPQFQSQAVSHRSTNYGLLYRALIRKENNKDAATESVDIESLSRQINQTFHHITAIEMLSLGTLMEFAGRNLQLADVDESSSMFQQLLVSGEIKDVASIQQIASAHVLGLVRDEEPTIANLYDEILQHWVASLPRKTPIRLRQNREQLARRIAAEVMLASHRMRHIEPLGPTIEQQHGSSQDVGMSSPTVRSRSSSVLAMSSKEIDSSPPLPSTSHSSVPPSSQPSLSSVTSSDVTHFGNPLTRLHDHLQLKQHSLTPTIIPHSVNQVLAHWELGTDPRAYSWSQTERIARSQSRDASTQGSSKAEQRRKERRERRQQRENEKMRSKSVSQTPSIGVPARSQSLSQTPSTRLSSKSHSQSQTPRAATMRSQSPSQMAIRDSTKWHPVNQPPMSSPGVTLGGMRSSCQPLGSQGVLRVDDVVPMSQVEPGRFGGRPNLKKRKKGRVSGF